MMKAFVAYFKSLRPITLCLLGLSATIVSCQKWEDKPGVKDDRLNRKYCNDPAAINYNWDFPGTPDNSVCYYPSDVFLGNYLFYDSVLNASDSVVSTSVKAASFIAESQTKFIWKDFCQAKDLTLTATKYFTASIDTLVAQGQLFCRVEDTVSGLFYRKAKDTITYTLQVRSDTGVSAHRGRAYKQP